ncbi:hypothetical protein HanRHA438_Chr14g0654661 [Helianthus annuus]|nr:hypothetical protein HanRHA438_Chr14g0654661 [Helianthus annuus]
MELIAVWNWKGADKKKNIRCCYCCCSNRTEQNTQKSEQKNTQVAGCFSTWRRRG